MLRPPFPFNTIREGKRVKDRDQIMDDYFNNVTKEQLLEDIKASFGGADDE